LLRVHRCDGKEWREVAGAAGLDAARGGAPCWIEVVEPDADERVQLHEKLALDDRDVADALEKEHPPVFRESASYVFIIVHAPLSSEQRTTRKVALFLGKTWVVSVLRAPVPLLDPLVEQLRRHPEHYLAAPERVAHAFLSRMADVFEERIDELIDRAERIEEEAIDTKSRDLLSRLHQLRRRSAHFARVVRVQRDVCQAIARGDTPFFSRDIAPFMRDVADHMLRIYDLLESVRDGILAARDTYLTAVNNQLNLAMRTLTAAATILLPLGLIASIFGMNFEQMPLLKNPAGFWIAMAAMGVLAGGMALFFKRRRWL
jgi:magnesium transporter